MKFRPWGELAWLLNKLNKQNFDLIGCLSTELRCTESFRLLVSLNQLGRCQFLEITDPINSELHDELRIESRLKIKTIGAPISFENHSLLEPAGDIFNFVQRFIDSSDGNIILDISSYPKRFFFAMTKLLARNNKVKNLVITYTVPEQYFAGNLSDNAQSWAPLPLYGPIEPEDENFDLAVVGVGFIPLGLPDLLKDKQDKLELKLLFPFPPGPPYYQRTWNFINQMKVSSKIDTKQIYRIDAKSVPVIYDKIESFVFGGKKILFAPYGPKTMSLAMCLSAIKNNSVVYYTQPTSYQPEYSKGISQSFAYLIKIDGENIYS